MNCYICDKKFKYDKIAGTYVCINSNCKNYDQHSYIDINNNIISAFNIYHIENYGLDYDNSLIKNNVILYNIRSLKDEIELHYEKEITTTNFAETIKYLSDKIEKLLLIK